MCKDEPKTFEFSVGTNMGLHAFLRLSDYDMDVSLSEEFRHKPDQQGGSLHT